MTSSRQGDISDLDDLLDKLEEAASSEEGSSIAIGNVLEVTGSRSFAPLLMIVGLLIASPLNGIPVFPTIIALAILLVSVQLLLGRDHFWLPEWLLNRQISRSKFEKAVHFMRPSARVVDKLIRPRLQALIGKTSRYVIAVLCLCLSLAMPAMELVPFSSGVAGVALVIFGLAMVSSDGLLALLAYGVVTGTVYIVVQGLLL